MNGPLGPPKITRKKVNLGVLQINLNIMAALKQI